MKPKNFLITFEGPEGSGKSTQIRKAAAFIKSLGYRVLLLREPGGTRISEAIRTILLDKQLSELRPETELMLYLAARAQIVGQKILPALKRGTIVVCDRFEDSTMAYQGYGRGFPVAAIQKISRLVRGKLVPNRTFLLDLPPKTGFRRIGRHDRMEQQSLAFHERVRRGFLELARKNKKRFVVIDATRDRQTIAEIIREKLEHDLG